MMKIFRVSATSLYIAWFLAIPLLGPDGTFSMCMKGNKPVECEQWKVIKKFAKYDDCFDAQMQRRGNAQWASKDLTSASRHVQDLRAACIREGDLRLNAK
jgi:hypothetical protein